ncbi:MAG TPA: hypothetical protein VGI39_10150 [Polyangiaceae bacterium]
MTDATPYSRRVSFNERLYLAAEALQPGFCVQIVVEGEGAVAPAALEAAVARAAEVNPGARLVRRGMLGWMRWVPEGPVPPVRVVGEWPDGEKPPPEVERPLPPETGPTCEVVLSPGPRPRLVFRCFHGVMDARGLLYFAEEVFRALRSDALQGAPCTLSDTEVVESSVGSRTRPALQSDCLSVIATVSRRATPVIWKRVTLEGPLPSLVARIAVAVAQHAARFHSSVTRVMVPVDLRNYRRELLSTGNMTYPLFLDVPPGRSWRDLHKEILKRLGAKEPMRLDPAEKILPWLPMWLVTRFYGSWIAGHRRRGRFPFTALVTHVALHGVEPLEGGGFTARTLYFLPLPSDFIPLGIAAVSGPDAAHLVVSAPRGLLNEGELAELCEALQSGVASSAA